MKPNQQNTCLWRCMRRTKAAETPGAWIEVSSLKETLCHLKVTLALRRGEKWGSIKAEVTLLCSRGQRTKRLFIHLCSLFSNTPLLLLPTLGSWIKFYNLLILFYDISLASISAKPNYTFRLLVFLNVDKNRKNKFVFLIHQKLYLICSEIWSEI